MANIPLSYWVLVDSRSFLVREITGREALSTPFRLEVVFRISDGEPLNPATVVKTQASIRLERDGLSRMIDGIVTRVTTRAALRGATETRLVIEPRLSLARYREDIRVFRNKTAPEIVVEVLSALGIATELRLAKSYPSRPYCVQHRESDLDFASRLLEDEGIFYFFLPGDIMVLADHASAYEPLNGGAVVPFRAGIGLDRNEEAIIGLGRRARLAPSQVTLRDFNPEKPSLDMDVVAKIPSNSGADWYDYPGEYEEPGEGSRKAELRAEAFTCASRAFVGKSFVGGLFPGCSFTLSDAPDGVADGDYAITVLEHRFVLDEMGYSNGFEALPADVAFRPFPSTPVPVLLNPMTGFVTCPPGEDDIYTDEWGRVKVHFHWDRLQPLDGECSHWIPITQDNTGGSSAIARRNWEVVTHFLEGDPDRPVVVGRVYHGEDIFPYYPPREKTRSALKSLSTPSRDGTNEIRFEDRAGEEHIWMHAQKDMNIVVAHDKRETIIANEGRTIHRDEQIEIGSNHTLAVGHDASTEIGQNQTWTVSGQRSREVRGGASSTITQNRSVKIGGMHFRRIGTTDQVDSKNLSETVGAVDLEISLRGNSTEGEKTGALLAGGAIIEIAKAEKNETSGKLRSELVGGVFFTKAGEEIGTRASKKRKTMVGGIMKVKSTKDMVVSAVDELRVEAGSIVVEDDKTATFRVGETSIVMTDGVMTMTGKTQIKVDISGTNKLGAKKSVQIK